MAASATQNPSSAASKSSKKKKSKGELPSSSAVTSAPAVEIVSTEAPESSNGDGSYESPYIKELYKSIRNVNKKIANASKVDNILAENPKLSLDELVASRKINTDQKAQILKKPSLQASLTQLEEQIAQYKKFDQEYKARSQKEKDEFEKTFTEKAEVDLSEAIASTKAEAASQIAKEQHDNMLVLSQFLSLAAIRRIDSDPSLDENKALEGVLLQVYRGNETAVASMVKLINGSDDPVYSTDGEALSTTYATVKALAVSHASAGAADEEEQSVSAQESESTSHPVETDPTTANAGMTELDDPTVADMINGQNQKADSDEAAPIVPENAGIDEGAANNAAGTQWDADNDLSKSQEWVEVPRDVGETDTGLTATPAVTANKQSWADEQADASASVNPNDGFHEVQRNRGGRDRGGRGGRGGDSGYRGRGGGYRGNDGGYRGGRGRGGPRGGGPREGGAPRQRRPEES